MLDLFGGDALQSERLPTGGVLGVLKAMVLFVAILVGLVALTSGLESVLPEPAVLPAIVFAVGVVAVAGFYGVVELKHRRSY